MLRWTHVPDALPTGLEQAMWRILHESEADESSRKIERGVRGGVIAVAAALPMAAAAIWCGAWLVGALVH